MRFLIAISIFFSVLILIQCKMDVEEATSKEFVFQIPTGFSEPILRKDNPITDSKIKLGKKLFFDPILSLDSSISCGSCHRPQFAYSDPNPISPGVDGKLALRNAPSLSNLAWHPYFFAEGGSPNLEAQILGPLEDPNEMAFSIIKAVERLKNNKDYVALFLESFSDSPSVYTTSRAIAAFERSLISSNSKFDRYVLARDSSAFNAEEKKGYQLFISEQLNCSSCHSGFMFTDFSFQNNGIYKVYADPGRMRLTLDDIDRGKFKVPSLRNIALTGPYMHDGSFESLEEIVDHYASGGKKHRNQSPKIQGFEISESDKKALVKFLHSLTDTVFTGQEVY